MGHGTHDAVVRYSWGESSAKQLASLGYQVSFKSYRGLEHSANDQELADLSAFLHRIVG